MEQETLTFNPIKGLQKKQKEIVKSILLTPASEVKYHGVRASRQAGKTWMIENVTTALGLENEDQEGAVILATDAQARKVYRQMLKRLPKELILEKTGSSGNRRIVLINGTTVHFCSALAFDSIAGNTFDFLICDEFALWTPNAWPIIRPTMNARPNAKCIIVSTPRGKNQFYNICMRGMSDKPKDSMYAHYYMSYRDNKYYDLREVEDAKNTLSEQYYEQEYEGKFVFGKSQVFGTFSKVQGTVKFLTSPVIGRKYFYGIDWSGDGDDKTVLTIIDDLGKVALVHEAQSESVYQVAELLELIKLFNAQGYSETNGLGKGYTDSLTLSLGGNVSGLAMTNPLKNDLVGYMLNAIKDNEIDLPTADLCPKLDNEMSIFESNRTPTGKIAYSHPQGEHDDYVDSLLMAWKAKNDFISSIQMHRDKSKKPIHSIRHEKKSKGGRFRK